MNAMLSDFAIGEEMLEMSEKRSQGSNNQMKHPDQITE